MKRVLVQAGHLAPREPGHEDQTGTTGEIETVTLIRNELCRLLNGDGRFEAIPTPGDLPTGIRVDAALFLHCDGASPLATGYSFGYPTDGVPAPNVNGVLADLIADEFDGLEGHPPRRKDNYTADEHFYYGFSRVDSVGPEVLVEHGFLTNPGERQWIRTNRDELAAAQYRALCVFFGFGKPSIARRTTLREWILARRDPDFPGGQWSWDKLKRTANWREWRGLGGQ